MKLLFILLLLNGCAHTWNCADYGVRLGEPMGALTEINELSDSEVERACGRGQVGCVIPDGNQVALYYRNGDECTLRHELCHVMNGPHHTTGYTQKAIAMRQSSTCSG